MTESMRALSDFWASFGLDAYPEGDVPDDAALPYITYTAALPDFLQPVTHQARVWYRDTGYAAISGKVDEIRARFGYPGTVLLPAGAGALCVRVENPFAQRMPMDATEIKCMYLNFELSNYTGV